MSGSPAGLFDPGPALCSWVSCFAIRGIVVVAVFRFFFFTGYFGEDKQAIESASSFAVMSCYCPGNIEPQSFVFLLCNTAFIILMEFVQEVVFSSLSIRRGGGGACMRMYPSCGFIWATDKSHILLINRDLSLLLVQLIFNYSSGVTFFAVDRIRFRERFWGGSPAGGFGFVRIGFWVILYGSRADCSGNGWGWGVHSVCTHRCTSSTRLWRRPEVAEEYDFVVLVWTCLFGQKIKSTQEEFISNKRLIPNSLMCLQTP